MSPSTDAQSLFSDFLRARRTQLHPAEVGLPRVGRPRRVSGLRREEVAQLASISADYYTRLEQGRLPPPSSEVLEAIAQALLLDDDERTYMRELAARGHEPQGTLRLETVARQTQALLQSITTAPAMVLGRVMDVLAWNELAAAFFVDFGSLQRSERNLVRLLFRDQRMRSRFPDWSASARVAASMLRMRAARCPHDPRLAEIVDELCAIDQDFCTWWSSQHVLTHSQARRTYHHPAVGDLDLEWCELTPSAQPDIRIIALTPTDEASRTALAQIGATSAAQARAGLNESDQKA